MHKIAQALEGLESFFTPYYCDAPLAWFSSANALEFTILGKRNRDRCLEYLKRHLLRVDERGASRHYDLVVTCADLVIPKNIRGTPIVLVQEGMTDPEGFWFHAVKKVHFLPRWLASTAAMGLSNRYEKFCVASDGYRDLFLRKGVPLSKLVVTGIPNFDECARYLNNTFPYHHYVLVCTSDSRETFRWENRKETIRKALKIAQGRKLIFKLHPNETVEKRIAEIRRYAPEAIVFTSGNTEEMIANCDVLMTEYSSTAYVGLALGKEVHSKFRSEELKRLMPLQHGRAAGNIALVCERILGSSRKLSPDLSKVEAA